MDNSVSYASLNRKQTAAPSRSVIDAWLSIVGNLRTEGEIMVEGHITGDIRCIQLIVAADATITGNVVADEVIVHGKVQGSIRANRVMLRDTAVVDCDIYYRSLSMDRGACFDGNSCRRDQPLTVELDAQIENLKKASGALHQVEEKAQVDASPVAAEAADTAAA